MDPTTIIFIVMLSLLLVALLVVPFFSRKKQAKEIDQRNNALKPGDLVKTIGGIIGTVIEIRQISPVDKEMVIETGVGDNKTTMVFDIAALYQIMSKSSSVVAAPEEPVFEQQNEVEQKQKEQAEEEVAVPTPENQPEKPQEPKEQAVAVEEQPVTSEQPKEETAATEEQPKEQTAATEEQAKAPAKPNAPAKKKSNKK